MEDHDGRKTAMARFSDHESDRPPGLPLLDGCPLDSIAVRSDVLDPEPYQVTGAKLAIDCQVEERQISEPTIELQARAYRPDMFRLQRWLGANELAFVPGALRGVPYR